MTRERAVLCSPSSQHTKINVYLIRRLPIAKCLVSLIVIEMAKDKDNDNSKIEDAAPMETDPVSSQKMLKNALYARCANLPADRIFSQNDLLSLEVIPNNDLDQLLSCTRQLTKEGLFKLMSRDGRACWKVVKRDDAAKYSQLGFRFC